MESGGVATDSGFVAMDSGPVVTASGLVVTDSGLVAKESGLVANDAGTDAGTMDVTAVARPTLRLTSSWIADTQQLSTRNRRNVTADLGRVEGNCQPVPAVDRDDRHREVHELAFIEVLGRCTIQLV